MSSQRIFVSQSDIYEPPSRGEIEAEIARQQNQNDLEQLQQAMGVPSEREIAQRDQVRRNFLQSNNPRGSTQSIQSQRVTRQAARSPSIGQRLIQTEQFIQPRSRRGSIVQIASQQQIPVIRSQQQIPIQIAPQQQSQNIINQIENIQQNIQQPVMAETGFIPAQSRYIMGSARQQDLKAKINNMRNEINNIADTNLESKINAECGGAMRRLETLDQNYNAKMKVIQKLYLATGQITESARPKILELINGLSEAVLEETHEAYRRINCDLMKKRHGMVKRRDNEAKRLDKLTRCCFGTSLLQVIPTLPANTQAVLQGTAQNTVV